MNQSIVDAIRNRKIVEFDYHGHHRVAEPHIYGSQGGVEELLVFQVGGSSSSGGLPEWRRVKLPEIAKLLVTDQTFAGPRPAPSGKHSKWDVTFEIVK